MESIVIIVAVVVIAGLISESKVILTKKGDKMAFVTVEDLHGKIECLFFPKIFAEFQQFLTLDEPLILSGYVSLEDVKKFFEVDEVLKYKVKLTPSFILDKQPEVENVLKHTVKSSSCNQWYLEDVAKDVLSYTVKHTTTWLSITDIDSLNSIFVNKIV
jgi:DNA polymerase III alpha subunit